MTYESTSSTAVAEPPSKAEPAPDVELSLVELDEILEIDVVDTVNPNPNEF